MQFPIVAVFVVGLFSTLHCVSMCGGIIGALTYSLPQEVRGDRSRLIGYLTAYSVGRISSYVVAGGLFGALGGSVLVLLGEQGHKFIQAAATILMSGIGLYIAGWFPKFARIERIGVPLWRRLEPIGRRLLPVRSIWHALGYGAIWGWLPCGMVYSMLLWSASTGGGLDGMAAMAAFGLGTLPAVVGAGVLTAWLGQLTRRPLIRKAAGLLLIAMALGGFFVTNRSLLV